MKYFTPDLLLRYGSEDPLIYKPAETEWEEKCEQYNADLNFLKNDLPAGLRFIEENFYLHDSVICAMGQRDGTFVIMLQLDTPPHSLLTMTYQSLQAARIVKSTLPVDVCTPDTHVEWQYAEIERVSMDPPLWSHAILLSNGWEVRLQFRSMEVLESKAVWPVPQYEFMQIVQAAANLTGL